MSTNYGWKQFEREAARLFGGRRFPANSGAAIDFESAGFIGQCKLVKTLSLEALTQLAEQAAQLGIPRNKTGVVCVKVRRGRGRGSPMLVVCTAQMWEQLNGTATLSDLS